MKLFSGSAKQAAGWQQTIDSAALPDAIKQMIREVTRRSRLWTGEKRAVAQELIGHFEDGLEAGRTAGDLIHTFGDVKVSAKLIRLSMRRKRPWWWQMQRRMQQAALALIAFYAGLWALLAMDHPQPKVDYLAMYNAAADQVPEQDKAWPIYRKAIIESEYSVELSKSFYNTSEKGFGGLCQPNDFQWPVVSDQIRKLDSLVLAIHQAARKPTLGLKCYLPGQTKYSDEDTRAFEHENIDRNWLVEPTAKQTHVNRLAKNMTVAMTWPHLNLFHRLSNLMSLDIKLAAEENRHDRAFDDYMAMLGMARQLGHEYATWVEQLVVIAIRAKATKEMACILRDKPEFFTKEQLDFIVKTNNEIVTSNLLAFDGEKLLMLDQVQRFYSDDGNGKGRLTLDGIRLFRLINEKSLIKNPNYSWWQDYLMPVFVALSSSRKQALREIDDTIGLLDGLSNQSIIELERQSEWHSHLSDKTFWYPKNMVTHAMVSPLTIAVIRTASLNHALCESIATAAAMELYHRKHGRYPDAIGDLVPEYLPTHPIDRSTGEPLRYQQADGKPLLYGCGLNGVDDGGVMSRQGLERWPNVPDDGDWILFPPPRREPYRP